MILNKTGNLRISIFAKKREVKVEASNNNGKGPYMKKRFDGIMESVVMSFM